MAENKPGTHSPIIQILLWSIAVILIAFGVYLSHIRFMDSEWLSRAGCLIVMLGIWSSLGSIMQERLLSSRMRWRRRNALTAARARLQQQEAGEDVIEKELAEIDDNFDNHLSDQSLHMKLSLGFVEVSLLLTGTFLWGFGDLLVR
ncbi:MAG: hypothetical protein OEN02_08615 [Gammaproteobacteria bacterium]|nr:hypothetical protein [Gammaproteobacteria bacterium]